MGGLRGEHIMGGIKGGTYNGGGLRGESILGGIKGGTYNGGD